MTAQERAATLDWPEVLPPRGPSLQQRRETLRRALVLRPWASDRAIAARCGVDQKTVRTTRKRMVAAGEIRQQPDRIGRDGKRYTKFSTPPQPERNP